MDLSRYSSIVVYGLGNSGVSCLKFFLKQGYKNIFATDDSKDAIFAAKKLIEGEFSDLDASLVFISPEDVAGKIDGDSKVVFAPGIPLYYPNRHFILDIVEDSQLVCDIDLFNELFIDESGNRKILNIGVTGTNGKSTICSFINYILLDLEVKSSLVGNIGVPIFDIGGDLADSTYGDNVLVTEVSSFQLDLLKSTGFNVAAISNVTEDHIQRHGNFENYLYSKLRIFNNSNKDDFLIVNYDDEILKGVYDDLLLEKFGLAVVRTSLVESFDSCVSIIGDNLRVRLFGFDLTYDISTRSIAGEHNKENYAIVVACVLCYFKRAGNLTQDVVDRVVTSSLLFSGIRHRMQFLGEKDGVKFVNDSKATNPDSVSFALDAYDNVFLIFGGYDKGADFDVIAKHLQKTKKVYVVGAFVDRIEKFLKKNGVKYEICFNLEVAFNKSFMDAKNFNVNDPVVMLSPGCASFDQWRNFEERGDYFCKLFDELK